MEHSRGSSASATTLPRADGNNAPRRMQKCQTQQKRIVSRFATHSDAAIIVGAVIDCAARSRRLGNEVRTRPPRLPSRPAMTVVAPALAQEHSPSSAVAHRLYAPRPSGDDTMHESRSRARVANRDKQQTKITTLCVSFRGTLRRKKCFNCHNSCEDDDDAQMLGADDLSRSRRARLNLEREFSSTILCHRRTSLVRRIDKQPTTAAANT